MHIAYLQDTQLLVPLCSVFGDGANPVCNEKVSKLKFIFLMRQEFIFVKCVILGGIIVVLRIALALNSILVGDLFTDYTVKSMMK